jgi:hypothetical protein
MKSGYDYGLSLPTGHQQMEPSRTSTILLHQSDLERQAPVELRTVVNLIGATRTKTGLRVKAVLDTNEYATGIQVSKDQMAGLQIHRHRTHPDRNYTLTPKPQRLPNLFN